MSTVGYVGKMQNYSTANFAPVPKDTRTIVREEIKRQKELDKLEEKYQNGDISKLEYKLQKALINNMPIIPDCNCKQFSTTA